MSGETTRLTEPQLRELAARGAAELDGAADVAEGFVGPAQHG